MSDAPETATAVIKVDGLTKRYGDRVVLDAVELTVHRGEMVVLTGPSGAGKTTLIELLGALEAPNEGTIEIDGVTLRRHTRASLSTFRRERVGIVFQLHNLIPRLTAAQNVELAMFSTGRSSSERAERARDLLDRFGLASMANRRPPQLSGGERSRVALARGLANNPPVLLADEPTGSLDAESAETVADELRALADDDGVAILAVSHDQRLDRRADRLLRLANGKITEVTSSS